MAYIGKQPSTKFSAAAKLDSFTGDGSTTTFDLTNVVPAGGENGLQVYVDNVRQKPGSSNAYSLGNDGNGDLKRITFTAAPDSGAEIYVITTYEATNIKNVGDGTITEAKIANSAVTSAKISDGTIVNADINACAAIDTTKLNSPGSSSVYLAGDGSWGAIDTSQQDTNAFNISLLGFKMAVNEGLTVFNLVDGVVDEFNDESGTDEAEGSNDVYCATSDFYQNVAVTSTIYSAGFTTSSITEPDTSTAGTNPAYGSGTFGTFTVPTCMTSVNALLLGAGGGGGPQSAGGSGGFVSGTIAVTPGQVISVGVGEGGAGGQASVTPHPQTPLGSTRSLGNGGYAQSPTSGSYGSYGGGLSALINAPSIDLTEPSPELFLVAGAGGGFGFTGPVAGYGGNGGGLTGMRGDSQTASTGKGASTPYGGGGAGGGSQCAGGQGSCGSNGAYLTGGLGGTGAHSSAGGGAGYYGGGGAGTGPTAAHAGSGGGGSSYYGHPQITGGSTILGNAGVSARTDNTSVIEPSSPDQPTVNALTGGTDFVTAASDPDSGEGGPTSGLGPWTCGGTQSADSDGYVFLYGSVCAFTPGGSSTIVSTAFSASSVPTTARIVVFEEDVETPTLNTDVIASVSRDGGTTFTNATLTDSGYVTGSSGQRILTGQATISGQPSGQSMRWKLALANNTVKIHGVSLQWA